MCDLEAAIDTKDATHEQEGATTHTQRFARVRKLHQSFLLFFYWISVILVADRPDVLNYKISTNQLKPAPGERQKNTTLPPSRFHVIALATKIATRQHRLLELQVSPPPIPLPTSSALTSALQAELRAAPVAALGVVAVQAYST